MKTELLENPAAQRQWMLRTNAKTTSAGWPRAGKTGFNHPVMVATPDHAVRETAVVETDRRVILLVSGDTEFNGRFQRAARQTGRAIVQIDRADDPVETLRSLEPSAVLLDLDLPDGAAWAIVDQWLQHDHCPPLFLLASHRERFDVRRAIGQGSVTDKTSGPDRLLQTVTQTLAAPYFVPANHNAVQRVIVSWLHPFSSALPVRQPERFWGINE